MSEAPFPPPELARANCGCVRSEAPACHVLTNCNSEAAVVSDQLMCGLEGPSPCQLVAICRCTCLFRRRSTVITRVDGSHLLLWAMPRHGLPSPPISSRKPPVPGHLVVYWLLLITLYRLLLLITLFAACKEFVSAPNLDILRVIYRMFPVHNLKFRRLFT